MAATAPTTIKQLQQPSERPVEILQECPHPIKITEWRVHVGSWLEMGRILLNYHLIGDEEATEQTQPHKLKLSQAGTLIKIVAEAGAIVVPGAALCEVQACSHATIVNDMCAECGTDLRCGDATMTVAAKVPIVHAIPDLKVSEELAQKLGRADCERLIDGRKLVLLVDLDQTLIHTTNDHVPATLNSTNDIYHFQLYGAQSPWYHTRFRPFTLTFLRNIHAFFELHICTFGTRKYAHKIAALLDADGTYFSDRILSRDECFDPTSKRANLSSLFPCGDNLVCIIDDREDVWSNAANLIHVKPYHFFRHTGDINAPPGLDKHEADDKSGVDFAALETGEKSSESSIEQLQPLKELSKPSKEHLHLSEAPSEQSKEPSGLSMEPSVPSKDQLEASEEKPSELSKELSSEQLIDSSNEPTESLDDKQLDQSPPAKLPPQPVTSKTNNGAKNASEHSRAPPPLPPPSTAPSIEIEDNDDYLLYLEDVLRRIHSAFYDAYDMLESGLVPDLKTIIPAVRSRVLRNCTIVLSGLVPTHQRLKDSKAYQIARSLGAQVSADLNANTTHLVAVRPGTAKVNAARRYKNLAVVTSEWLWACAERWEHVEEEAFPLNSKRQNNRHPPAHCTSPPHQQAVANEGGSKEELRRRRKPAAAEGVNRGVKETIVSTSDALQTQRFSDTINPLMRFSQSDIADMDKEVEDILDDDSSSSSSRSSHQSGSSSPSGPKTDRNVTNTSSEDSLTGEYPKGYKRRKRNVSLKDCSDMVETADNSSISSNSSSNCTTDDGGDWNMMGAALEREFLSQ